MACLCMMTDPPDRCGFQGSPTFLMNEHTNIHLPPRVVASHVAMTYGKYRKVVQSPFKGKKLILES